MRCGDDVMRRSTYKRRISRSQGRDGGSSIHQLRALPPAKDARNGRSRGDDGGPLRASVFRRMSWVWSLALIAIAIVLVPATADAAPRKPAAPAGPPGWSNPRALELAKEAIEAKKEGKPQLCVEKDQASLALEDHPYVKLHLASCLQATGKLVDALNKAKDALGAALRTDDQELQRSAQARVADLLPRIAHVKLLLPTESSGIKVTFDNIPVRPALFKQRIAVDPGDHVVEAERTFKGEQQEYKDKFTLADGEEKTLEIVLKPVTVDKVMIDCLEHATSYDEKLACVERKSSKPSVHIGLESSGYTDSTNVHVFSPSINAAVSSPTAGWNVGASYLVDIVTAASPDIVSMASRSFKEARHAAAAGGGYKVGSVGLHLNGNLSSEPDYLSKTLGAAIDTELSEKSITPRLGYNFSYDRIGIRNTPFKNYERNLTTNEMEAGVTFVLSPTTLLVTGLTAQIERGEESKLYRYVPTFAPGDVGKVAAGQPLDGVNEARLPVRVRELLPRARDRFSAGARINHRLSSGTLRVEERVYVDNWGIKASTTDAKYFHDLGDHLRVWPHLRFHGQTGASFYRIAYPALLDVDNVPLQVFTYRTGDRELSPMVGLTIGAGARIALTTEKASVQYAIVVSGEVLYNRYFNALYIKSRTAVYGTLGFEVEF
jgi:Protein of unknown function (DUF3570)